MIVCLTLGALWLCFEYVATKFIMCYFCFSVCYVCCVLMLLGLYCTSCKLWKSCFAKIFQWRSLLFFWLAEQCKTTWSVHDILVTKEYIWDLMFQHVCNIWPLSVGQCCCCCSEHFFWICATNICCYLLELFYLDLFEKINKIKFN